MPFKKNKILLVGGLDPLGYSGVLADLEAFAKEPVQSYVVLSALTAQSKGEFLGLDPSPINIFKKQLKSLAPNIDGVKIGMLASPAHAQALAQWIKQQKIPHIILDPVLKSSSGASLFDSQELLKDLQPLLKQVSLLTPNQEEAQTLLKEKANTPVLGKKLLKCLKQEGHLLIKGGHSSSPTWTTDYLISTKQKQSFRHRRLPGNPRGTGCRLASLILSELLKGKKMPAAYQAAWKRLKARLWPAP